MMDGNINQRGHIFPAIDKGYVDRIFVDIDKVARSGHEPLGRFVPAPPVLPSGVFVIRSRDLTIARRVRIDGWEFDPQFRWYRAFEDECEWLGPGDPPELSSDGGSVVTFVYDVRDPHDKEWYEFKVICIYDRFNVIQVPPTRWLVRTGRTRRGSLPERGAILATLERWMTEGENEVVKAILGWEGLRADGEGVTTEAILKALGSKVEGAVRDLLPRLARVGLLRTTRKGKESRWVSDISRHV
jgi:hypothetical protein